MQNENLGFADALKLAQENGYAEADPTLDINGGDASHKIILLIKLAFGIDVSMNELSKFGIENIDKEDIEFAKEINSKIKLICYAKCQGYEVFATVRPMMVKNSNFLSEVNGATNALRFSNQYSGSHILVGEGAGSSETASSIVADIVFAARYGKIIDNETEPKKLKFCNDKNFKFPYLVSFSTEDAPGTTGFITTEIGAKGINIDTVGHNRRGSDSATFSVSTMPCKIDMINEAIENIKTKRPQILVAEPKIIPILY
jgi:homoserine dehydrogenase